MTTGELAALCREASEALRVSSAGARDGALRLTAEALDASRGEILAANAADVDAARSAGLSQAMIDRLALSDRRVDGMISGLYEIAALPDPIGSMDFVSRRPNGLQIGCKRVPLGVVGVIFESRPNVTVDSAALCLKAGNACLLRGGKEAIRTNRALAALLRAALVRAGLPAGGVCLVEDTSRDSAVDMMGLVGLLDVLVPRGGASLIRAVVENARVPVIQTGEGNCHIYVDDEADLDMATRIVVNAKCSRPSTCNAAETLLVAESVAEAFLPKVAKALWTAGVELRGCEKTRRILGGSVVPADESDWGTEYNDLILAVRVVPGLYQATSHIARYGTKHSEAIVTKNLFAAQRFADRVDAAAVYINASTRFTDGGEFGFGAELGISTQKLHARGPMGLQHLTTVQYVVLGEGQIRE